MVLWIVVIIFSMGIIGRYLSTTDKAGGIRKNKIRKFCFRIDTWTITSSVLGGIILVLMLVQMVIVHIEVRSLTAQRNAVQMTLNTYRESTDTRTLKKVGTIVLERVGAIQQVFVINKEIGVAKYWHSTAWFGVFWPDSVVELEYIK